MSSISEETMSDFLLLRTRHATQVLARLDESSATGPDRIGTIFLKRCVKELGLPFCKLYRVIVKFGRWPSIWIYHWICPIYKKKSRFLVSNYRGIQLISQLSKAAERLIGRLFLPFLWTSNSFGGESVRLSSRSRC